MSNDKQPLYCGPERRAPSITEERVALMVEEAVDERVAKAETNIKTHIDLKFGQLHHSVLESTREMVHKAITDHVESAFPDEQLHRHRDYHQSKIKAAETGEKIKTDIYSWAIKGVITVLLFLLGLGVLEYAKRELSK